MLLAMPWLRWRREVDLRTKAPTTRPTANLVHAAGRPLPAGVPRAAEPPLIRGSYAHAFVGGRDHAAADAPLSPRRRHRLCRHHDSAARDGRAGRVHTWATTDTTQVGRGGEAASIRAHPSRLRCRDTFHCP